MDPRVKPEDDRIDCSKESGRIRVRQQLDSSEKNKARKELVMNLVTITYFGSLLVELAKERSGSGLWSFDSFDDIGDRVLVLKWRPGGNPYLKPEFEVWVRQHPQGFFVPDQGFGSAKEVAALLLRMSGQRE